MLCERGAKSPAAAVRRAAGDYWPGEAENLLANLGEEQRQPGKSSSKGARPSGEAGNLAMASWLEGVFCNS